MSEYGEGAPVAWAISNREDITSLSLFLEQLRLRSGDLKPKYLITDDVQQYWNAWVSTYEANNTSKLLCTWNIARAWWRALQEHIGDVQSRALVYHQLQLLLSETDEMNFHVLLQVSVICCN